MLEEQGHEQVYSFKCSLGFCLCHACGILLINISLTKAIHMIGTSDLDIERQGTAWEKGWKFETFGARSLSTVLNL